MHDITFKQTIAEMAKKIKDGSLTTMAPLLSFLQLDNNPMNLKFHFFLAPLYQFKVPRRFLLKTARQVGKSYGICSQGIIQSNFIKDFHTLYIQPRYDQICFLSSSIVRPLIHNSYIYDSMMSKGCMDNVKLRIFNNGSRLHFSYCFLDAERIRGLSGISKCSIDEIQDINIDFLPIIGETMSASRKYGFYQFTGTPKTTDNTLNELFLQSSMGEWVIPCKNCKKLNVPSADHDLLKMIGKHTCICSKCGKPLDARDGWYEYAFPKKLDSFKGLHISQVIHPLHYTSKSKWQELLYKQKHYTQARFYNEVLGEPWDENTKLISNADLKYAQTKHKNDFKSAVKKRSEFETVVIGIDWSGGGALLNSYTAIAIVGVRIGSDALEVIYGEKLSDNMQPAEETNRVLDIIKAFRPSYVAHDYGGAGALRETLLLQSGVEPNLIVPYTYVASINQEIIKYSKPTTGSRRSYSIDKARSLTIMCNMLKARKILLPEYESALPVTSDLLALCEEARELPLGSISYIITKTAGKTDDFAHAINYACSTIWHVRQAYPTLIDSERFRVTAKDLEMADPSNVKW